MLALTLVLYKNTIFCKDQIYIIVEKTVFLMIVLTTILVLHTVNSEILARILFSRIALKDIFAMVNIRDFGMNHLLKYRTKSYANSRGFIFAKLCICEVSRN